MTQVFDKLVIGAGSDPHGSLSISVPTCDVLVMAGDLPPNVSTDTEPMIEMELDWLRRKFIPYAYKQRKTAGFKKLLVGGGNHDLLFADPEASAESARLLLETGFIIPLWPGADPSIAADDPRALIPTIDIDGILFAFHAYTQTYNPRDWAFSYPRSSAMHARAAAAIPDDTDVLVVHSPPHLMLDKPTPKTEGLGCPHLLARVLAIGPQLTICGHIHERRGERMRYRSLDGVERRLANVSLVDGDYKAAGGKYQTFEIKKPSA